MEVNLFLFFFTIFVLIAAANYHLTVLLDIEGGVIEDDSEFAVKFIYIIASILGFLPMLILVFLVDWWKGWHREGRGVYPTKRRRSVWH